MASPGRWSTRASSRSPGRRRPRDCLYAPTQRQRIRCCNRDHRSSNGSNEAARGRGSSRVASWSPDGTRLAFDTGAGILVGLRTGPSKARLVASGGSDYWPVVSSSGARPKPLAPMYLGGWARHRLWWFTKLTGRTACTGAGCVGIDQSCPSVSRVGEPGSSRVPPTPAFARGCRLAGRRCLRRGSSRGTASSAPPWGRRRTPRGGPLRRCGRRPSSRRDPQLRVRTPSRA